MTAMPHPPAAPIQMQQQPVAPQLPQSVAWALTAAASVEASDVHIAAGEPPWQRLGGRFAPMESTHPLTPEEAAACYAWAGGDNRSRARDVHGHRWRVTSFASRDSCRIAFRRIPTTPPLLKTLKLPPEVQSLAALHDGLILTAGPTGSGKTTTLAALIETIVRTRATHLLTIEEPVEYIFESDRALVSQRELGDHLDIKTAMLIAMRADPDVILLGEIRTAEDVHFCLELAASGHLVLSTIHGSDTGTVCERFETAAGDTGRSILAQVLRAIIVQRLLPDARDERRRHLAVEWMLMSPAYRGIIRPGGNLTKLESRLIDQGRSLDNHIAQLVLDGKVQKDVAENAASNPEELARSLSQPRRTSMPEAARPRGVDR